MSTMRLYGPVIVILIAALAFGIERGVGMTVVFLVVLAWSIYVHVKEVDRRRRVR